MLCTYYRGVPHNGISLHYCSRLDRYLPVDLPADGPLLPFCTQTFSLDFSMHTFEHLHVSGCVLLYCITVRGVAVK